MEQNITLIDTTTNEQFSMYCDYRTEEGTINAKYVYNKSYSNISAMSIVNEIDEFIPISLTFKVSLSTITNMNLFKKFSRRYNKEYQMLWNYNGKDYFTYVTMEEDSQKNQAIHLNFEEQELSLVTTSDFFIVSNYYKNFGSDESNVDENYDYTYDLTYSGGGGTVDSWNIELPVIKGDLEAIVNVEMQGGYSLINSPGYEIGNYKLQFKNTFVSSFDDYITVNAISKERAVGIYKNEEDVTQQQEFLNDKIPYIKLEPDNSYTMTLHNTEEARITIYERYRLPR